MIVISLSSITENYYFGQIFENDYGILKFLFDHLTFFRKEKYRGSHQGANQKSF